VGLALVAGSSRRRGARGISERGEQLEELLRRGGSLFLRRGNEFAKKKKALWKDLESYRAFNLDKRKK